MANDTHEYLTQGTARSRVSVFMGDGPSWRWSFCD